MERLTAASAGVARCSTRLQRGASRAVKSNAAIAPGASRSVSSVSAASCSGSSGVCAAPVGGSEELLASTYSAAGTRATGPISPALAACGDSIAPPAIAEIASAMTVTTLPSRRRILEFNRSEAVAHNEELVPASQFQRCLTPIGRTRQPARDRAPGGRCAVDRRPASGAERPLAAGGCCIRLLTSPLDFGRRGRLPGGGRVVYKSAVGRRPHVRSWPSDGDFKAERPHPTVSGGGIVSEGTLPPVRGAVRCDVGRGLRADAGPGARPRRRSLRYLRALPWEGRPRQRDARGARDRRPAAVVRGAPAHELPVVDARRASPGLDRRPHAAHGALALSSGRRRLGRAVRRHAPPAR